MIRRLLITAVVALTAGLSWPAVAGGKIDARLEFSVEEVRRILQHGPWPPPWRRDPSNRVSGKPAAIEFGEALFFEQRLSRGQTLSCAGCHVPEKNWTDGRKLGAGLEEVDRNTPSVVNVRLNRWFGWDGANDNLWAQSMRPLLDQRELALTEREVAAVIRNDRELACRYRRAFGALPPADDEAVLVDVGKALAAFEETLTSGRTPFDDFRDALARGDRRAAARYPAAARRGLRIFVGKGACNLCHFGPNFTNGEFHEIGISVYTKTGGIDWGRYQGIKMLAASRFNLEGAYNDDARRTTAVATRHVAIGPQTYEQFRIPTLRNVALTAPYMHNGNIATLRDVVKHYSTIDLTRLHLAHVNDSDGVPITPPLDKLLKPLDLSDAEIDDVVAFLESLTDRRAVSPRRPRGAACR